MIETERLLLRKPVLEDAHPALGLLTDPVAMAFLGGVHPDAAADPQFVVSRWLERWNENGSGPFSIVRREDGRWLGRTGLLVWDVRTWTHTTVADAGEFAQPELGWALASEHWGHGYATEAALAVRELGLHRAGRRAPRLADRAGECPLAAARRTARRHPRRDGRALRQRPPRRLDASRMIRTERLILRRPRPEDASDLAVAYADPEVVRFIGDGRTATLAEVEEGVEEWLERWESWGMSLFSLQRNGDGRVLGRAGFLRWNPETWQVGGSETELGWLLAREHWGHGYATEAGSALRDWAFAERGMTRLISLIQNENAPSIRVAERLGERYERRRGGSPRQAHSALLGRAMTELRPLAGARVVDVTSSLAGPTATQLLAALGADVVKVEPPVGDHARAWGPPFLRRRRRDVPRLERGQALRSQSTSATSAAARSCCASPTAPMCFVQSLRPGAAERHGLGAAELQGAEPAARLLLDRRVRRGAGR